jgi:hypothetical protein
MVDIPQKNSDDDKDIPNKDDSLDDLIEKRAKKSRQRM